MEKFILSCSKGLAEFTRTKSRTIQFIHESVRDFLLSRNGLEKLISGIESNVAGRCHETLKHCCHKYLEMDMSEVLSLDEPLPVALTKEAGDLKKKACDGLPFLEYAVHNMFYHSDAAEEYDVSQESFLLDLERAFPSCENPSDDTKSRFGYYIYLSNLLERYGVRRYTPDVSMLYFMADNGLSNLLPLQLEKTPDISVPGGGRHETPIWAALSNPNEKVFRTILGARNITSTTPNVLKIVSKARVETIPEGLNFLWQHRGNINKGGVDAILEYAFTHLHRASIHLLLTTYGRPPKRSDSILLWAAAMGYEDIIAILLTLDGSKLVSAHDEPNLYLEPLRRAVSYGNVAIVEQLLLARCRRGVSLGAVGDELLLVAAEGTFRYELEIFKLLLEKPGVDVNCQDSQKRTLLIKASLRGHMEAVRVLLKHPQVDVNRQDAFGDTALIKAVWLGHEGVAKLLLDTQRVDINLRTRETGQTALFWAAIKSLPSIVKLLLATGQLDIESKNQWGETQLVAALTGDPSIDKLLEAYGR
jgi:ankyrin repeat protein